MPVGPAAATGIGAVALLAGALYYFWPAIKGYVGFGLFSRVDDRAVLDLPARRRLHDAIVAEPGIHFMALARKASVGRGALAYHLRRLEDAGLVVVRKAPGYTCFFAQGSVDWNLVSAAPLLRSEGSRAVFEAVQAAPGLSGRELARRLGRSASTVNYHLQRLQAAGLVFGEGAGIKLSPLGEKAAAAA
jgi:predicted transcriptional regulator